MPSAPFFGILSRVLQVAYSRPRICAVFVVLAAAVGAGTNGVELADADLHLRYVPEARTAYQLAAILTEGPALGVNSLIWARGLAQLTSFLPMQVINSAVNLRVFYGKNPEHACETLTGAAPDGAVRSGTMGQYKNSCEISDAVMRLYNVPDPDWVLRYAQVRVSTE